MIQNYKLHHWFYRNVAISRHCCCYLYLCSPAAGGDKKADAGAGGGEFQFVSTDSLSHSFICSLVCEFTQVVSSQMTWIKVLDLH